MRLWIPVAGSGVASVVMRQCLSCHGAKLNLGAPMSLVSWSDFQKPSVTDATKQVYVLVGERVQDAMRPMPPKSGGKIAVADRTALVNWTAQGAPALASGAPDCQ